MLGATPSTCDFESTSPRWIQIADFQWTFARSASAVASSKKVQLGLTLIGSQEEALAPLPC